VGATKEQLAAAARLRRLDETAKIIVIDEAADNPDTATLRNIYHIDLRPYTRFISADMGYSNVATLEDALTRHVYQEEFDRIINLEPYGASTDFADIHATELGSYMDADIAAHIKTYTRDFVRIKKAHIGGASGYGRCIADEIFGRTAQTGISMELQTASVAGLKLAFFGQTEMTLNAQQMPHMYSVLPIPGGFCKLIYDDNGDILGFATLGQDPVVTNCADTMTTLVKMGGTIQNMVSLELIDGDNPLPTLGKIAQNVVEKRLFMAYADEINQLDFAGVILMDVRPRPDFANHHINVSINIPLEDLRESIYRLERNKEIITICSDGKDSYLAARILMGHGFKTRHLTGGLVYAKPIVVSHVPQY